MLASMKGEINSNTIIVGDFSTPLTLMDRSIKQNVNNKTQALNDTVDQLGLIDIYGTFHSKTMDFTFSQVHKEHSAIYFTSWAIKIALVNSNKLKSFQSSFLITIQ